MVPGVAVASGSARRRQIRVRSYGVTCAQTMRPGGEFRKRVGPAAGCTSNLDRTAHRSASRSDTGLSAKGSGPCRWPVQAIDHGPWQRLPMRSLVAHADAMGDGCGGAVGGGPGPQRMGGDGRRPVEMPASIPITPYAADKDVPDLAVAIGGTRWFRHDSGRSRIRCHRFGDAGWIVDGRQWAQGWHARLRLCRRGACPQRNQRRQNGHEQPRWQCVPLRASGAPVGADRALGSRIQ
jgi:hypothetical protein